MMNSLVSSNRSTLSDSSLSSMLESFRQLEPVFDSMPDIVFFMKDIDARYTLVNRTLVSRCGFKEKSSLLGKRAEEVFPQRFGPSFTADDRAIICAGEEIIDQVELHLYPGRRPGWCLTTKKILRDNSGCVIGIAGISRDLKAEEGERQAYGRLAIVVDHIRRNYVQPLSLKSLADMAEMSVAQLERYFQKLFQLTPRQLQLKIRLAAATGMLASDDSVTDIAVQCGYTDHSAFTRQFKTAFGVTPTEYRAQREEVAYNPVCEPEED